MSVQLKYSTAGNSNTKVKTRQPKQEDVEFSRVLSQIRATRRPVENHGDIGDWEGLLPDINAAILTNQVDAILAALTKSNPHLSSILAMLPDQDEQEDLHPDFRIGKQGKKVFKTLSEDEIEDFPDIEYMVSGLLQTSTVSLVFSESNSGKTFVALDIAEHIARGMSWQGRRVKPGPVLYIYAESKIGLKPRILAWKKHHALASTPNLQFITRPVQLVNDRDMLLDTLAEQEIAPALVVIDTFSNCSIGVNQNDQAEVTKVLMVAHEIVREYGSHVMVVHHTNKSGSANGSQAFKNHCDSMIELKRADKYSPIVMHCEKQRDAEQFDDISLQLQIVDLWINPETLEPVTSCVVVASSSPTSTETALSQTQQKMLDILELQGRTSFNAWKKACEDARVCKPTSFYMHVQTMVEQGKVKKEAEGPGKKTWYEVLIETSSTSSKLVQTELVELATN